MAITLTHKVDYLDYKTHNPNCNIVQVHGTSITTSCRPIFLNFGKDLDTQEYFIEIYMGPNYIPGGKGKNYSKCYHLGKNEDIKDLPMTIKPHYSRLKGLYQNHNWPFRN
mgnify:FL=1